MHVFLVEDDRLVREVVSECLVSAGMCVTGVADAEAALERWRDDGSPDLLVTDIDLGAGLNGFELASCARNRWPDLPILFISGIPRLPARGAFGPRERFLPKPFRGTALVTAIDELASA